MPQPRTSLRRRLLAIIRAVLIALTIALSGLWTWSKYRSVYITRVTDVLTSSTDTHSVRQYGVQSNDGRLWIAYLRTELANDADLYPHRGRWLAGVTRKQHPRRYMSPPRWAHLGIDWYWNDESHTGPHGRYTQHELYFCVPHWMLIAICASTALLLSFRPWRQRRRMRRGLCPECGYDVRATPDHCPECGCGMASA